MEQQSNKKIQIIDTARELFTNYGYKKVSMDEIAKASGVTKRTIYRYFEDKDTLFRYFIDEERQNIQNIIHKIEERDISFFKQVHETLLAILKYRKESKLLNTLQQEADLITSEKALIVLKEIEQELILKIKTRLEWAIKEEKMKQCDVDFFAFLLVKLYVAIMLEWDVTKKPLKEQEISDNIIQLLKTGIFY